MIKICSSPKVHWVTDIVVVDIPEAYGLFLSRDWSKQLKGYFATNWSNIWFPLNGKPNNIRMNKERYMKHIVTELNDPNEPVMFT